MRTSGASARVLKFAVIVLVVLAAAAGVGAAGARAGTLPSLISFTKGNGSGSASVWSVREGHPGTESPFFGPVTNIGAPRWSPNGEEMFFSTPTDTLLVNRAGKLVEKLGKFNVAMGAWSPDGHEIAGTCYQGTVLSVTYPASFPFPASTVRWPNLCVVNIVPGSVRVIASSSLTTAISNGQGGGYSGMSWSADGKGIAVDTQRFINTTGFCVNFHESPNVNDNPSGPGCWEPFISIVSVGTGSITPIGSEFMSNATFAPHGQTLAFLDASGNPNGVAADPHLAEMDASGVGVHDLLAMGTNGGTPLGPAQPAFSSDGKQLAFASFSITPQDGSEGLYVYDLHTLALKKMTGFSIFATQWVNSPSWSQPVTLCTVPKLKGQLLAAARKLVLRASCTLGKIHIPRKHPNKRHVYKQSPLAGTNVAVGTKVSLWLK
jgi:hypothetical protein